MVEMYRKIKEDPNPIGSENFVFINALSQSSVPCLPSPVSARSLLDWSRTDAPQMSGEKETLSNRASSSTTATALP